MKLPQILGFLKILSESIKLVLKNVKVLAPITALSLLLSSILFLLFIFFYQSVMAYITNTIKHSSSLLPIILLVALIFAVEFTFLLAFIAIAQVCGITTVIATAASYTGGHSRLSLQDLYATLKTKWRSPFKNNHFRPALNPMHLLGIIAVAMAVPIVMFYPNPIAIAIVGIVGVAMFVFEVYASVPLVLAAVIPVVEDGCEAAEAMERAEELVEGQRLDGFMVNLFFNILWLLVFFSLWKIIGDIGSINLTVYGVFFVSSVLAMRISMSVVYTVYYFQCKEYHGDKIQISGNLNFHYTALINDIP